MRILCFDCPSSKQMTKLHARLDSKEEQAQRLMRSLENGRTENLELREEIRRYRSELSQSRERLNAFVLEMALEGRPEAGRVSAFITDIQNLTAELIYDLTEDTP